VPEPLLESILVANRGEIALRVIRACRDLGIRSVAVYSDADRASPHVAAADFAYRIGPPSAAESYLDPDRILEAAEQASVQAIHPGYGFLAERASFARAVTDSGLVFVGPSADTIAAMGDKTEARRRMQRAGVPIVPGITDPIADADSAHAAADSVGYPVLLKASAGGGGKGMRVVRAPADLIGAFEAATREALAAFGDGAVYLERFLDSPRHIEVQILGDSTGRIVHLGERECSIQRRHQKLLEEAPSALLTEDERGAIGDAAVQAARAVGYVGAGTIEFLWDSGEFHFLEMNTRIQVEHPVTEFVTGIDLVEWQLRIASGQALTFDQQDIALEGHAIECRITAEDVASGFLPATGTIRRLGVPGGPQVRWDAGIRVGQEVGLNYDSLLGKLVVHGETREAAIERMVRALGELQIEGVETSISFHHRLLQEAEFRAGEIDIGYLDRHPELMAGTLSDSEVRTAAVLAALLEERARAVRTVATASPGAPPAGSGADFTPWQRAAWPWAR